MRMIKSTYILLVVILSSGLTACGSDSKDEVVVTPTPTPTPKSYPFLGTPVKGPLTGAIVNIYRVDVNKADFIGELVSSGITNAQARTEGVELNSPLADGYIVEFIADENTIDITTGKKPVISKLLTYISKAQVENSEEVFATSLTTLSIKVAVNNQDSFPSLQDRLGHAGEMTKATLGFGLDNTFDLFKDAPILSNAQSTIEQQQAVILHRGAIEAAASILYNFSLNNNIETNELLDLIASDLADGLINAQHYQEKITQYSQTSLTQFYIQPEAIDIANDDTQRTIANIKNILISETSVIGYQGIDLTNFIDDKTPVIFSPAALVIDVDNDGLFNNIDTDDDGDNVADDLDVFPYDREESVDTDNDGLGNNADLDDDNDDVLDGEDAFPLNFDESLDSDGDGIGNNADTDDDNDNVLDENDAFPFNSNESLDTDGDGIGNNTDTDDDNDGIADVNDAFPLDDKASIDSDKDGIDDILDLDDDNDNVLDVFDDFPLDATESVDTDGDGIGNNADGDDDGDGVTDVDDLFPLDSTEAVDTDGDGIGNNADTDDDGDGIADVDDENPLEVDVITETPDTETPGTGNPGGGTTPPPAAQTLDITGSGVKGPMAFAEVKLYQVDTTKTDFKGSLISTASTDASAQIVGLSLGFPLNPPYILEIKGVNGTYDITTSAYPVIDELRTVLTQKMLDAGEQVYATPLTTMAVDMAFSNADSNLVPFTGDNNGTTSEDELAAALPIAAEQVKSTLGFGLGDDVDIFDTPPLIDSTSDSAEKQADTTAYRSAVEALTAVVYQMQQLSGDTESTTADILGDLTKDLSDGEIDGKVDGVDTATYPVAALEVLDQDPATLPIPGTDKTVGEIKDLIVAETVSTGSTVDTSAFEADNTVIELKPAETNPDIDNDGIANAEDAFPEDSARDTDSDQDGLADVLYVLDGDKVRTGAIDTAGAYDTDDDNDGVLDVDDAFRLDSTEYLDTDNDGKGNNADLDDDGDNTPDSSDDFPLDSTKQNATDQDNDNWPAGQDTDDNNALIPEIVFSDTDNDGIADEGGNTPDTDDDNDGVLDGDDAFPLDASESRDLDNDGIGNNTDTDIDGDNVINSEDKFPFDPNESLDTDRDGIGNNTDEDDDGDGLTDSFEANLGTDPLKRDTDDDGVLDATDALPLDANERFDSDKDTIGNNTDNCPLIPNTGQINTDGDDFGDACDRDDDGDNVLDINDAFPLNSTESLDTDGDGIGNGTDTDNDNDGVLNDEDAFPLDATEYIDTDGDEVGDNSDPDIDGDGVDNADDAFPLDENASSFDDTDGDGWPVGQDIDDTEFDNTPPYLDTDGDGLANTGGLNPDLDDDNDGVPDVNDVKPLDPSEGLDLDNDGTGDSKDTDIDGDGVLNGQDAFPRNAAADSDYDQDGIPDVAYLLESGVRTENIDVDRSDSDDDNDGVLDVNDVFSLNADEWADVDGDEIGDNADTDWDNDDVLNDDDAFPLDENETLDTDFDGVGDVADTCPLVAGPQTNTDSTFINGDDLGDVCDDDDDADGTDDVDDEMPLDPTETKNFDGDELGDIADTDDDNDTHLDDADAFPFDASEWLNSDNDSFGDNGDNCPLITNEDQLDSDADNIGDVCDDTFTPTNGAMPSKFYRLAAVKADFVNTHVNVAYGETYSFNNNGTGRKSGSNLDLRFDWKINQSGQLVIGFTSAGITVVENAEDLVDEMVGHGLTTESEKDAWLVANAGRTFTVTYTEAQEILELGTPEDSRGTLKQVSYTQNKTYPASLWGNGAIPLIDQIDYNFVWFNHDTFTPGTFSTEELNDTEWAASIFATLNNDGEHLFADQLTFTDGGSGSALLSNKTFSWELFNGDLLISYTDGTLHRFTKLETDGGMSAVLNTVAMSNGEKRSEYRYMAPIPAEALDLSSINNQFMMGSIQTIFPENYDGSGDLLKDFYFGYQFVNDDFGLRAMTRCEGEDCNVATLLTSPRLTYQDSGGLVHIQGLRDNEWNKDIQCDLNDDTCHVYRDRTWVPLQLNGARLFVMEWDERDYGNGLAPNIEPRIHFYDIDHTDDLDFDSVGLDSDAFPYDGSEWADTDVDGVGDNADAFPEDNTEWLDTDEDGTGNNADVFPNDPNEWADLDGDNIGDNADQDRDGDGVNNDLDALPENANESIDTDGDGIGNNADTDDDGDGTADTSDYSPLGEQLYFYREPANIGEPAYAGDNFLIAFNMDGTGYELDSSLDSRSPFSWSKIGNVFTVEKVNIEPWQEYFSNLDDFVSMGIVTQEMADTYLSNYGQLNDNYEVDIYTLSSTLTLTNDTAELDTFTYTDVNQYYIKDDVLRGRLVGHDNLTEGVTAEDTMQLSDVEFARTIALLNSDFSDKSWAIKAVPGTQLDTDIFNFNANGSGLTKFAQLSFTWTINQFDEAVLEFSDNGLGQAVTVTLRKFENFTEGAEILAQASIADEKVAVQYNIAIPDDGNDDIRGFVDNFLDGEINYLSDYLENGEHDLSVWGFTLHNDNTVDNFGFTGQHSNNSNGDRVNTYNSRRLWSQDSQSNEVVIALNGTPEWNFNNCVPEEGVCATYRERHWLPLNVNNTDGRLFVMEWELQNDNFAAMSPGTEQWAMRFPPRINFYQIRDLTSGLFNDPMLALAIRNELGLSLTENLVSHFESITELNLSDYPITDLTGLEQLTNLTTLNISSTQVTDIAVLTNVSHFTNLTSVNIDNLLLPLTQVEELTTRVGVENVDGSPAIAISDLTFVDANLQVCVSAEASSHNYQIVTDMTTLSCRQGAIADLSGIGQLTALRSVDLSNDDVNAGNANTISDFAILGNLLELRNLEAWDVSFNDAGFSAFSNHANIEHFGIGGNVLTSIAPAATMANLRSLHVWGSAEFDISVLSGLANFNSLALGAEQISDVNDLTLLSLDNLWLNGDLDDETAFNVVLSLPPLQHLSLGWNSYLDNARLQQVINAFPGLASLGIEGTLVTDLTSVLSLTNLQQVNIDKLAVSQEQVELLIANGVNIDGAISTLSSSYIERYASNHPSFEHGQGGINYRFYDDGNGAMVSEKDHTGFTYTFAGNRLEIFTGELPSQLRYYNSIYTLVDLGIIDQNQANSYVEAHGDISYWSEAKVVSSHSVFDRNDDQVAQDSFDVVHHYSYSIENSEIRQNLIALGYDSNREIELPGTSVTWLDLNQADKLALVASDLNDKTIAITALPTAEGLGTDNFSFASNGTGTTEITALSFTWSVVDSEVTINFADVDGEGTPANVYFRAYVEFAHGYEMFVDGGFGAPGNDIGFAHYSYGIVDDSTNNLDAYLGSFLNGEINHASRYDQNGERELVVWGFGLHNDADSNGVGTVDNFSFNGMHSSNSNGERVNTDSLPRYWQQEGDATLLTIRYQHDEWSQCDLADIDCHVYGRRYLKPIASDNNGVFVIEWEERLEDSSDKDSNWVVWFSPRVNYFTNRDLATPFEDKVLALAIRNELNMTLDTPFTQTIFDETTNLDLSGYPITNLTGLASFTNLTDISINDTQVNQLDVLLTMGSLTYVNINNLVLDEPSQIDTLRGQVTNVEGDLTVYLSSLTFANDLQVCIDDTGATTVGDINHLDCSGREMTSLSGISQLTALTNVNFDRVHGISDFTELADLAALENVGVSQTNFDNDDFSAFENHTNIKGFGLHETALTSLASAEFMPTLEELHLWDDKIFDLTPLYGLANFQGIALSSDQLSNVNQLSSLTHLKRLWLNQELSTDELSIVFALTGLDHIALGWNSYLTNDVLTDLVANWPNLTSLGIEHTPVTDVTQISLLNNLEQLQLNGTNVSNLDEFFIGNHHDNAVAIPLTQINIDNLPVVEGIVGDNLVAQVQALRDNENIQVDGQLAYGSLIADALNNIPDPQLKQCLIDHTQGLLVTGQLKELWCEDRGINSIDWLGQFDRLVKVDLNNNHIIDLNNELRWMNQLTELHLDNNLIHDIGILGNNDALIYLGVDNLPLVDTNQVNILPEQINIVGTVIADVLLNSLSFSNDAQLGECVAAHSSDITNVAELTRIDCSNYAISDITDISQLTSLFELRLNDANGALDLSPLSQIKTLTVLSADNQGLNNSHLISIAAIPRLEDLNLSNNDAISDLSPLANVSQLKSLHLWGGNVLDLTPLTSLAGFNSISMSADQLSNPVTIFGQMANLEGLFLNNELAFDDFDYLMKNLDLTGLSQAHSDQFDNTFMALITEHQPRIGTMWINNTNLSDITNIDNLIELQDLHIQNTLVTDLQPLIDLRQAQDLLLVENEWQSLFNYVDISGAPIADESQIATLQGLGVQVDGTIGTGIPIADLNFADSNFAQCVTEQTQSILLTGQVTHLGCSDRSVTSIDGVEAFTSLTSLDINENHVADLSFLTGITTLQELHIMGNEADDIDLTPLVTLPNFTTLALRRNQLNDFEGGDNFDQIALLTHLTSITVHGDISNSDMESNGNFEAADLSAWELFGGSHSVEVPSFGAQEGDYAVKLTNEGGSGVAIISQSFSASPGDEFYLSGYMRSEDVRADGSEFGILKVGFWDEDDNALTPVAISKGIANVDYPGVESLPWVDENSPVGEWIFSEAQGVAPPGAVRVSIELTNVNFAGVENPIWFDDINMVLVSDSDMNILLGLSNIETLDLGWGSGLGDDEFASLLAVHTGLKSLSFQAVPITSLAPLSNLTDLHSINIQNTNVTDLSELFIDGLVSSGPLDNLSYVNIEGLAVIDGSTIEAQVQALSDAGVQVDGQLAYGEDLTAALNQITDPQLKQCLIEHTHSMLVTGQLKELDCSNRGINDIWELWRFDSLTKLNLSGNNIIDLGGELDSMQALEELHLDGNLIADINTLHNNPALTYVGVDGLPLVDTNQVNTLPGQISVAGNVLTEVALNSLTFADGQLQQCVDDHSGGLTNVVELTHLNCNDYGINNIDDINQLSSLHDLKLDRNSAITDLNVLAGIRSVTILSVEGLVLTDNDVNIIAGIPRLESLNLADNHDITDLGPFSNTLQLKDIHLWGNNVLDLTPLTHLNGLTFVALGVDQLGNSFEIFTQIVNLESLWLNGELGYDDFSYLMNNLSLVAMSQSYNNLFDDSYMSLIIQHQTGMQTLFIENTQVSDLSSVGVFTRLEQLQLQNTLVTDLQPLIALRQAQDVLYQNDDWKPVLNYVNLESSPIVDGTQITALQSLGVQVDGTPGSGVPIANALIGISDAQLKQCIIDNTQGMLLTGQVTDLGCANQSISSISGVEAFSSLISLDINDNNVTDLSVLSSISTLQELHIMESEVDDLDLTPLISLPSFTTLAVRRNQLDNLAGSDNFDQISQLGALTHLHVHGDISSVDMTILLALTGLESLDLGWGSGLGDSEFSSLLAVHSGLKSLAFQSVPITSLAPLSNLTDLQSINIQYSNVTDLSELFIGGAISNGPLTNLNYVNVHMIPIVDGSQVFDQINALVSAGVNVEGEPAQGFMLTDYIPTIEDAALRQCIIDNSMNMLVTGQLANLWCQNVPIAHVWGLSEFINLEEIYLDGTLITEVNNEFDSMTNLRIVSLNDSQLRNLGQLVNYNHLQVLNVNNLPLENPAQVNDYSGGGLQGSVKQDLLSNLIITDAGLELCITDNSSGLTYVAELHELNCNDDYSISDISSLDQLYAVSNLGLNNDNSSSSISDFSSVNNLPQLESLSVGNTSFGDSELSNLSGSFHASRLNELSLSNTLITDLTSLVNLPNLNFVHLWGSTKFDLSPLANAPRLNGLALGSDQLDSSDVNIDPADLLELASLQQLYLHGPMTTTEVSDTDPIDVILQLTQLKKLSIGYDTSVDNSVLASIASNLTELEWSLELASSNISDLTPISALTKLKYLDISTTLVTDISPVISLREAQDALWQSDSEQPLLNDLFMQNITLTDPSQVGTLSDLGATVHQ